MDHVFKMQLRYSKLHDTIANRDNKQTGRRAQMCTCTQSPTCPEMWKYVTRHHIMKRRRERARDAAQEPKAWMNKSRSEVARPTHGHLVSAQVVNQRLYISEDTLGVRFITHDHHVLHLQQRHALGVVPEEQRDHVYEKNFLFGGIL